MTFVCKFTFSHRKNSCPPNLNFVKTEYDERLQILREFGSHIKGRKDSAILSIGSIPQLRHDKSYRPDRLRMNAKRCQ